MYYVASVRVYISYSISNLLALVNSCSREDTRKDDADEVARDEECLVGLYEKKGGVTYVTPPLDTCRCTRQH